MTFLVGLSLLISPQYKAFADDLQTNKKPSYNIEQNIKSDYNYNGIIKNEKVTYFGKSTTKVNILTGTTITLPKSGKYKATLETIIDGKKVEIPFKKYFPNSDNLKNFINKYNNGDIVNIKSNYKTPEGIYTLSDIKMLQDKK